ncbi:PEP-CTERM sorting domain-containing protein [Roseateles violae]|uniref:PEP-CTERM sorting domain-containing protein n=1 Tax=Roseateles violae TaxID=3058042 RepID=A0ABT8DPP8_9BURK|nr:PEP-CTERM sorting domain-containing protein [Pelomonas sp. PFR6]MDN3919986.1 PEP-CTERM sorting domain-containing protein [Pelomonas sp. PFR6]
MKKQTHLKKALAAAALSLLAAAGASAASVHTVPYASLSGAGQIGFEGLAEGLLEGVVGIGNVQFGERFAGQELSVSKAPRAGEIAQDWFDHLGYGAPTAGLSLLAGAAGANLGVYDYGDADGKALAGIGPLGGEGGDAFGLGAISARFAAGQSALGFQLRDADGGNGWLALYRADGSLIQSIALGPLQNGFYAFAREGGVADIAGFSLYNADPFYGVAIDQLRIAGAVTAVPEPASPLLMLAGLPILGAVLRRRLRR